MALSHDQLEARINYIGASEVAGVLGLSRWSTPLEIWSYKTGNLPPKDLSDHLPVILGNRLEEVVAELFTQKTGKKVRRVNETFYHPKHKFLACNIDRRIVGEDTLLECKTASSFKAKEWKNEEIPQEYLIQVQQMLSVTGYKRAYLAVLIGNTEFLVKEVLRDETIISQMTHKLVQFWNDYVVTKQMPGFITSNDADNLYSLFPMESGAEIELGDEVDQLIEARSAMLSDLKGLQNQLDKFDNEIKAYLKDASTARTKQNLITWKNQSARRLDTKLIQTNAPEIYDKYSKEINSRVLRIKPITITKE